jgi:hypothetical protein
MLHVARWALRPSIALRATRKVVWWPSAKELRYPLQTSRKHYLLAGATGSLFGFVVATFPFIYVTAQPYITRLVSGYWLEEWPPFWWPKWLPWFGPFEGFIIGSILGFVIGCYVFAKRSHKPLAT